MTGGGDHGVYVGSNAVFRLQGGAIAGNESNYAGGGVFVDRFGTFEMSGGSITNNSVSVGERFGGGVYVARNGTFTMTGGEISGNKALNNGGGVRVDGGGTFEMTGGEISGNTAKSYGGGVYVYGTFTMTGGEISGNKASNNGGGVNVANGGTFTLTSGEISGNTANYGGGVYVVGTFTVSDSPVVSGSTNSVGAANNVCLNSWRTIAVNGLSPGARIGVTTKTTPTLSNPITIATGASAGDAAYFFSDVFGYDVEQDGSNLLLVGELPQGFKDPEGREIEDYGVVDWLSNNGFTQADINALGHDAAATDRLYECWLLNLNFKVQDAGATLSFTDITVSNRVSMTVQLVRKAPLAGRINGTLLIYGANNLAAGFDRSPIPDESVEYFTGDPTFNLVTASNDTVTQTAVATLNSSVTAKFFKAEIGIFISYEPEEPWEPEPEPDPDPED